jgi:two-component system alkaline phosphatase synthesis response regulator PhoP
MNKTILLVDDSSTTRVRHRILITQKTNYKVDTAGDGQEAVRKAVTDAPALILMDVMMPGMSGLEVCETLKKDERTKRIPVVLLTFKTGKEFAQAGFDSGCDEYLTKPVDEAELVRLLDKYLG